SLSVTATSVATLFSFFRPPPPAAHSQQPRQPPQPSQPHSSVACTGIACGRSAPSQELEVLSSVRERSLCVHRASVTVTVTVTVKNFFVLPSPPDISPEPSLAADISVRFVHASVCPLDLRNFHFKLSLVRQFSDHSQFECNRNGNLEVEQEEQGSSNEIKCNKNHHWLYRKIIADAVEALVGAFIVDSGFKAAIVFLTWLGIQVGFEASKLINVCRGSVGYSPFSADISWDITSSIRICFFSHLCILLTISMEEVATKQGSFTIDPNVSRLEFSGDAVLDFLITSYLYSAYPKLKRGQLTDLRSLSVNNKSFACVAVDR
ncbi:hypothetical protein S245_066133, partial [Arachis hypogaea]